MGMNSAAYMDHNATTTLRPEAAAAVRSGLGLTGNPSSVHRFGRLVRRAIEDARDAVAALVGARPAEVVLTSGGTEANNLAIRGVCERRVLASAVEHPSVLGAADAIAQVPVDGDGIVDLAALTDLLAADTAPALVSVMLANNETGVVQPLASVAEIAHSHGAVLHCDAVQAAGKIAFDCRNLGVDLLTLSAHKLGGPAGVGALVIAGDVAVTAVNCGGGQERGFRAGTENAAGIAGFGAAAAVATSGLPAFAELARWRDRIEQRITKAASAQVFGAGTERLPNTSCLAMPGVDSETQVMAFDLAGIAVSAGSACSAGKVEPSHVLDAMGVDAAEADCAIRVSLGWDSTEADAERFIDAWIKLYQRLGDAPTTAMAV